MDGELLGFRIVVCSFQNKWTEHIAPSQEYVIADFKPSEKKSSHGE